MPSVISGLTYMLGSLFQKLWTALVWVQSPKARDKYTELLAGSQDILEQKNEYKWLRVNMQ